MFQEFDREKAISDGRIEFPAPHAKEPDYQEHLDGGTLMYGLVILKLADMAFSRSYLVGLIGAGRGVCVLLAAFRDFMDLCFSTRYSKEDKDRYSASFLSRDSHFYTFLH